MRNYRKHGDSSNTPTFLLFLRNKKARVAPISTSPIGGKVKKAGKKLGHILQCHILCSQITYALI